MKEGRILGHEAVGEVDPGVFVTEHGPMTDVIAAHEQFDRREPGWLKVSLNPAG